MISFVSFQVSQAMTFMAGLGSGVTEAILVVTPAEVCKIRLQVSPTPFSFFRANGPSII